MMVTIISYLAGVFLPFMILAFINDPSQTVLIYLVVMTFLACGYFLCLAISAVLTCEITWWFFILIISSISFVVYFLVILLYVLTLGSFDVYQELQSLLIPLIIGAFSIFAVRPSIYYFSMKIKEMEKKEKNSRARNDERNRNEVVDAEQVQIEAAN